MKSTILTILVLFIIQIEANRLLQQNVCTQDVKQCPDGSYVARDPNNNCQFFPCPGDRCKGCPQPRCACIQCPNSKKSFGCCGDCQYKYDESNNLMCSPVITSKDDVCPDPVQGSWCGKQGIDCPASRAPAYTCSDGTCYGNCGGCTYQDDATDNVQCLAEINVAKENVCPCAGLENCDSYTPDGCNICGCPKDGSLSPCTLAACPPDKQTKPECRKCSDGYILKDGVCIENIACTDDVKQCPDKSFVGRDPANNCQFFPCPATCCDPEMGTFPNNGNCFEGCACCPDGSWSGSIGDGKTFDCGGKACIGAENCGGTICETVGCGIDHCNSYFDGCNHCSCGRDGLAACTLKACAPDELVDPYCTGCQDGYIINKVTNKCEPEANVGCGIDHCNSYFDGCNSCKCSDNELAGCTKKFCPDDEKTEAYCTGCEDGYTLNPLTKKCEPTLTCANKLCVQGTLCYQTSTGPACCDPDICQSGMCGGIGGLQCNDGYECVDDPINPCDPKTTTDCAGVCVDIDDVANKVECTATNQDCDTDNGYRCRIDPRCRSEPGPNIKCAKNKFCLKFQSPNGKCVSQADCNDGYECVGIVNGNGYCIDYQIKK